MVSTDPKRESRIRPIVPEPPRSEAIVNRRHHEGTRSGFSGRASDALALCVLLTLAGAFFFPLSRGATFSTIAGHHSGVYPWRAFAPGFPDYPQSDQADLTYPWQAFINRTLRSGSFPLWNPGSFGGQPFFANGSSGVLYPPRLIAAAFLPLGWAHEFLSIFHMLLSGVGMWLLLRELRLGVLASMLGSTAWMLGPFNMVWLHLEVVAPAAGWLPLSLMLTLRAVERRSWRTAVGATTALACTLVGGHLLFMGLVYVVAVGSAAALVLARTWRDRGVGCRDHILRLSLIAVGPWALAAVVLLPTVLFLHDLGREPRSYESAHVGVRVPYRVFAGLLQPPTYTPVNAIRMGELAYVGRIVAVLAVIGFFTPGLCAWLGRALALGTFLVATDTLLLRWAYAVLPQFSFFAPLGRLLNLFDFGMVLLGAVGLDVCVRWTARVGRAPAAHRGSGLPPVSFGRRLRKALQPGGIVLASLIVVGTAGELVGFARRGNPPFPPREPGYSYPPTPLIRALGFELSREYNGPGRILPIKASPTRGWTPPILYAAEPMVFGFESASGYDSTVPQRSETVLRILGGEAVSAVLAKGHRRAFVPSFDVRATRFELLPRLGVTTIVATPDVDDDPDWRRRRATPLELQDVYEGVDGRIYRIKGAAGGPWVLSVPEMVQDGYAALQKVLAPEFDHHTRVVLERDDVPPKLRSRAVRSGSGSARVLIKSANVEEIEVRAESDAWVVVPTSWDAGWRAWVNGREAPVVRANYLWQAVPVPAGASHVRIVYRPRGLGLGLAFSSIALSGLVLLLVRADRRPARPGPSACGETRDLEGTPD